MSKLVLMIAIALAAIFWWRLKNAPNQAEKNKMIQKGALYGLLVGIILLAAAGRIHWVGAVFAAAFPLLQGLFRLILTTFPLLATIYRRHTTTDASADQACIARACLELRINRHSGRISGTVRAGNYSGKLLDQLNRVQLNNLQSELSQLDPAAIPLLAAYLEQRYPGQTYSHSAPQTPDTGDMSKTEARALLGVSTESSTADIRAAHKRLIQKLHPDQGGNHYLATKINQARDILTRE